MLTIKRLCKNVPCLVKPPEDVAIEAETATLLDRGTDPNFQVLSQVDQGLNISLIGSRLNHDGNCEACEEFLLILCLGRILMHRVHLVVEVPERDEFALWEPSVLEAHRDFNPVQCLLDVLQDVSDLSEKATRAVGRRLA